MKEAIFTWRKERTNIQITLYIVMHKTRSWIARLLFVFGFVALPDGFCGKNYLIMNKLAIASVCGMGTMKRNLCFFHEINWKSLKMHILNNLNSSQSTFDRMIRWSGLSWLLSERGRLIMLGLYRTVVHWQFKILFSIILGRSETQISLRLK